VGTGARQCKLVPLCSPLVLLPPSTPPPLLTKKFGGKNLENESGTLRLLVTAELEAGDKQREKEKEGGNGGKGLVQPDET
jgi:hypothetical protein